MGYSTFIDCNILMIASKKKSNIAKAIEDINLMTNDYGKCNMILQQKLKDRDDLMKCINSCSCLKDSSQYSPFKASQDSITPIYECCGHIDGPMVEQWLYVIFKMCILSNMISLNGLMSYEGEDPSDTGYIQFNVDKRGKMIVTCERNDHINKRLQAKFDKLLAPKCV